MCGLGVADAHAGNAVAHAGLSKRKAQKIPCSRQQLAAASHGLVKVCGENSTRRNHVCARFHAGVCVCVSACVHACVHACVRACAGA